MVDDKGLADRIRRTLVTQTSVREVKMFGGLSFMVNERMVVGVMGDGALLVRVDPQRASELLTINGARQAEMGAGGPMGKGWIAVADDAVATQEDVDFWIEAALEYSGSA